MIAPTGGRRRPPASILIAGALIVVLGVVVIVAGFTVLQLPFPITNQAHRTHTLYEFTLAISMIVYFGVTAGIIWAVMRFRRRGPELPPQIHGSSRLEFLWTVIPVLILLGLFIPSLILIIDLKTPPASAKVASGEVVTVEVIGHQWWWEFKYQNGPDIQPSPPDYNNLTPPTLTLPVGQEVRLLVRSTDVVHSFYAPHTLYKIQAVPGNVNELHFTLDKTGTFTGQCYQFCGLHHSEMRFVIDAVSPDDFQRFLSSQKPAGTTAAPDTAGNSGSTAQN